MNKRYIETKICVNPRHHLIEDVVDNVIGNILSQIIKEGEYRIMPRGDSDVFIIVNERGCKTLIPNTEVYSIPLSKCKYDIIFALINSVVQNAILCKQYNTDELLVLYRGCKVKGENIDIHIGIQTEGI